MSGYTIEEIRELFEAYVRSSFWNLELDRNLKDLGPNDYIDIDTRLAFEFYRAGFNAVKVSDAGNI